MSLLPIAILSMVSALTFYTIGVWGEKIVGRLKSWHLIFFWHRFVREPEHQQPAKDHPARS